MNVKFTFKVEADGVTYTDYALELPIKSNLATIEHNHITHEILKQLEAHRFKFEPPMKSIPLQEDNARNTPPKCYQHTQTAL